MKIIVGLIFLLWESVADIRTRKLGVLSLWIFGVIGILLNVVGNVPIDEVLLATLPGIIILTAGVFTGESIGYGDGIVMIIIGLLAGLKNTVEIGIYALFIAMAFSIFLIVVKKANKKTSIPFVPFMLLSYIGVVVV